MTEGWALPELPRCDRGGEHAPELTHQHFSGERGGADRLPDGAAGNGEHLSGARTLDLRRRRPERAEVAQAEALEDKLEAKDREWTEPALRRAGREVALAPQLGWWGRRLLDHELTALDNEEGVVQLRKGCGVRTLPGGIGAALLLARLLRPSGACEHRATPPRRRMPAHSVRADRRLASAAGRGINLDLLGGVVVARGVSMRQIAQPVSDLDRDAGDKVGDAASAARGLGGTAGRRRRIGRGVLVTDELRTDDKLICEIGTLLDALDEHVAHRPKGCMHPLPLCRPRRGVPRTLAGPAAGGGPEEAERGDLQERRASVLVAEDVRIRVEECLAPLRTHSVGAGRRARGNGEAGWRVRPDARSHLRHGPRGLAGGLAGGGLAG